MLTEEQRIKRNAYMRAWSKKNRARITARRKQNKEHYHNYQRTYRESNPEYYLFVAAKHRAKAKNLEFNIEITDIKIPDKCPLLEIPLKVNEDRIRHNSMSLDRIDNSKGYVKGNVWVISVRANTVKNNASIEELNMLVTNLNTCVKKTSR